MIDKSIVAGGEGHTEGAGPSRAGQWFWNVFSFACKQASRFACFTIVLALICAQVPLANIVLLLFVQRLMYEGHRNRALAHRRGDPFDIAGPDVADREHTGQTGFKQLGSPGERPMSGGQILLREIGSGFNESLGIKHDALAEPLGVGNGTHHEKDVSDVVRFGVAGLMVAPPHSFEMLIPFQGDDFAVGSEDDGRILFDAANQITRHAISQPVRSHEHVHALARLREEDSRLAG